MKTLLLLLCGMVLYQFALAKGPDSAVTKRFHNFKSAIILAGSDPITVRPNVASLVFLSDQTVGAYYQLQIAKHFGVKIGYSEWNNTPLFHLTRAYFEKVQVGKFPRTYMPESILTSLNYKSTFCYFQYVLNFKKRWKIYPQVGLSYTFGDDDVLDSVHINPDPPSDAIIYTSSRKVHYWGIIPSLSADYLCFRGRGRIGVDVSRFNYFGFYYHPVDIGCHAGFNF